MSGGAAPCGQPVPGMLMGYRGLCALPAGHLGCHQADDGAMWTATPPAVLDGGSCPLCGKPGPWDSDSRIARYFPDHGSYRAEPAVLDGLAAGIEEHVTQDAAREAVARWLHENDPRRPDSSEDERWDALADRLLSLPELQALIGGQPSGALAEVAAEAARQESEQGPAQPLEHLPRSHHLYMAASYFRSVLAIDRRTGDGQ